MRPHLAAHSTELVLELPDEPMYVDGGRDRLQQIHANLLSNAASYSPDGSKVQLSLVGDGADVVLRVKDNGMGINEELLPHIFELFVQAEQKLDRSRGGLGIGLTLVKTLVELHDGTIVAKSDGVGKGSEFVVRLPFSDRAPESTKPAPLGIEAKAPSKILIVEDHDDSRELLKTLLEAGGYSVAEAADGPSALAMIGGVQPDVALVDIGLPGMDGYEFARTVRARGLLGTTLLVALTGYGQESDIRRGKEAGFDRHQTKPVKLDVLAQMLREV